jgi:hypothetical protein
MRKRRSALEVIVTKLRQVEVLLGQGKTVGRELCKATSAATSFESGSGWDPLHLRSGCMITQMEICAL